MESLLCRSNLCCSNISKTTYPSSNISKVAEISHNLKFITIFSYLLRGGIIWHINSIAGPTHVILDSAQPSFDLGAFFFCSLYTKMNLLLHLSCIFYLDIWQIWLLFLEYLFKSTSLLSFPHLPSIVFSQVHFSISSVSS